MKLKLNEQTNTVSIEMTIRDPPDIRAAGNYARAFMVIGMMAHDRMKALVKDQRVPPDLRADLRAPRCPD